MPPHTPEDIERLSFSIIDEETGESRPFTGDAWAVARRLVHTAGDLSLLADLILPETAIRAGVEALRKGAPVITDTTMALAGIPPRRFPAGYPLFCMLSRPGVAEEAARLGCTRSRAAVLALGKAAHGAIIAIGNAPTALLALLESINAGGPLPALVIGMPVGFVNAAESKELLLACPHVPSLVLRGRRGGSPLAAATVNALACLL